MAKSAKTLAQMKANPRDWRIETLKSVAEAHGILYRQPGGSHVIFRHANGAMLSVPAKRPIKPIYVKMFVRLIEDGAFE
jgi:predicted RNA binding protein YcfA (HicA-like mRNA interferase family)